MKVITLIGLTTIVGVGVIGGLLFGVPKYSVYQAEMRGKAILAQAESSKKAQIADAEAKYESAKYLKAAAAEIQSSLSPQYLDYLRIQMQEEVGAKNDRAVYFIEGKPSPVIPINK